MNPKTLLLLASSLAVACTAYLGFKSHNGTPQDISKMSSSSGNQGASPTYEITERRDTPDYIALDVSLSSPAPRQNLKKFATSIIAREKLTRRTVIWFYQGNLDLGTYDSKDNKVR